MRMSWLKTSTPTSTQRLALGPCVAAWPYECEFCYNKARLKQGSHMKDINERLRGAARNGSEEELKSLLCKPGCDTSSEDKSGMTALMYAALGGYEACVEILIPVSDLLAKSKSGMTALMHATYVGNESCVRLLLPASDALAQDAGGWTALMRAAYYGYEACVRLLMPASDPCAKTAGGLTAGDLARSQSHVSLGHFIDAYVLAQNERFNIDAAASPRALSGKPALRV